MDHILQQMQAFSQQCAEILSEIVGIDVSITDNQQMRIAGSGRMKGRVGNIAAYGHIALHALETRQTTVVLNPIANPICQSCETRSTCDTLSASAGSSSTGRISMSASSKNSHPFWAIVPMR